MSFFHNTGAKVTRAEYNATIYEIACQNIINSLAIIYKKYPELYRDIALNVDYAMGSKYVIHNICYSDRVHKAIEYSYKIYEIPSIVNPESQGMSCWIRMIFKKMAERDTMYVTRISIIGPRLVNLVNLDREDFKLSFDIVPRTEE